MGLSDLIKWNVWTITSLDPEITIGTTGKGLEGQFQPEGGASWEARPALAESATVGSDRPAVQFVHGGKRVVKFRSSFVSLNQLDDIGPKLDALEALDRKDDSLGRAPRVSFQWSDLEIEGFARVRKRVVGFWGITEWPKRVDFEIEIVEALELDLDGSGSSSGETQHVTLGLGETFEVLGARYLGSPLRGELIRRENPSLAAGEAAGDRVKVLERSHPRMRGRVRPSSPPFLDVSGADVWADTVTDLAEDRGTTTRGLSWDRLPEVVAGEVG